MESAKQSTARALTKTMKAAVQTGYGAAHEVIDIAEVPIPEVGSDRVLIRVTAASMNALDWHYMTGTPRFARLDFGLTSPKRRIPGADVAGTVVAVGEEVTDLALGDDVFGDVGGGGFAEFAAPRASLLAKKPSGLSMEQAATLGVAALTALQGLRDWGRLQPDQRVLINGASGGVGTFAVQIAKALGAGHVTAVCSTRNVDLARSLGADEVVDYTRADFASTADRFDVFFDNAGSRSLGASRNLLADDGVLVMVTGRKGGWIRPADRMLAGMVRSRFWSQDFMSRTAKANRADLDVLKDMVVSGQVSPVIDRRFALDEVVDAMTYQAEGHARGKSLVSP